MRRLMGVICSSQVTGKPDVKPIREEQPTTHPESNVSSICQSERVGETQRNILVKYFIEQVVQK